MPFSRGFIPAVRQSGVSAPDKRIKIKEAERSAEKMLRSRSHVNPIEWRKVIVVDDQGLHPLLRHQVSFPPGNIGPCLLVPTIDRSSYLITRSNDAVLNCLFCLAFSVCISCR